MHLLYLDESGAVGDASQRHFVLAGVSVFERQTHWIEQELNKIAARFDPAAPHNVELHGAPMRGGRGVWRRFPVVDRVQAISDALAVGVVNQAPKNVRLFGAVIRKADLAGVDAVEHAFEHLSQRFDLFLGRLYKKFGDAQRGLIVFDKASTETRIQTLARDFKYNGHTLGRTRNYCEVPVFLDSRASRLIQLADLVSYSLFRHFEAGDSVLYDVIKNHFDHEGGIQHGLYVHV